MYYLVMTDGKRVTNEMQVGGERPMSFMAVVKTNKPEALLNEDDIRAVLPPGYTLHINKGTIEHVETVANGRRVASVQGRGIDGKGCIVLYPTEADTTDATKKFLALFDEKNPEHKFKVQESI